MNIQESELHDEIYEAIADNIGNIIIAPTVKKCITAAQQYTNNKLSAAKELLLQAKYQLAALDNQWPTKGTKAVIQEIENFLK